MAGVHARVGPPSLCGGGPVRRLAPPRGRAPPGARRWDDAWQDKEDDWLENRESRAQRYPENVEPDGYGASSSRSWEPQAPQRALAARADERARPGPRGFDPRDESDWSNVPYQRYRGGFGDALYRAVTAVARPVWRTVLANIPALEDRPRWRTGAPRTPEEEAREWARWEQEAEKEERQSRSARAGLGPDPWAGRAAFLEADRRIEDARAAKEDYLRAKTEELRARVARRVREMEGRGSQYTSGNVAGLAREYSRRKAEREARGRVRGGEWEGDRPRRPMRDGAGMDGPDYESYY